MTSAPDEPAYRLYTSAQAARRAGGGLTKSTFDELARSGLVAFTRIARRTLWTDAQIAAAIAHHETHGSTDAAEEAKASAAARRSASTGRPRGNIAPLVSKPGRRYAAS